MGMQSADWTFTAEAHPAFQARTAMVGRVRDLSDESMEIVLLLTSELVTNAVRHGAGPLGLDSPIGVHIAWGNGDVFVRVRDRSPEWPAMQAIDCQSPNGRGLRMVDGLSSDWGVSPNETGKTVWFTL